MEWDPTERRIRHRVHHLLERGRPGRWASPLQERGRPGRESSRPQFPEGFRQIRGFPSTSPVR